MEQTKPGLLTKESFWMTAGKKNGPALSIAKKYAEEEDSDEGRGGEMCLSAANAPSETAAS